MLHSVAPGIPLPLHTHTHIRTLINHEYTHTIGEAICSLFSAAIKAQIEWSVWEEDNGAASRPPEIGY